MSERIGLASLPSDGKLSRSAHSLRVVHALREAIVSGAMAAGAPLVETAIARTLGVSRGPVRTALHELHAQGLVEITPTGRSSAVGFDHERLLDLLAVRWQLESQAVRWGLERKHGLEDVIAAYAAIEAADGASGEELAELDMVFHRALVAFSGSRALMSAWSALAPVVTTVLVVANRRTQLSAHAAQPARPRPAHAAHRRAPGRRCGRARAAPAAPVREHGLPAAGAAGRADADAASLDFRLKQRLSSASAIRYSLLDASRRGG